VYQKNKWGMEQDRLFKFDMLSRTLQTFDLKMECKSEYRLAVITEARITIPTDFFGNPVSIEKATEVVLYFCDRGSSLFQQI
jgi:hypothetical protein